MQAAPAVTVSAGRDRAATVALSLLNMLAVVVCAAWAIERGDALGVCTLAAVAAGSTLSLRSWFRQPAVQLRWDGQCWWVASLNVAAVPQSGQVAVAVDLDGWLLLRFRADEASRGPRRHWFALGRSTTPRDWHLLRCALYSPRRSPLAQG